MLIVRGSEGDNAKGYGHGHQFGPVAGVELAFGAFGMLVHGRSGDPQHFAAAVVGRAGHNHSLASKNDGIIMVNSDLTLAT